MYGPRLAAALKLSMASRHRQKGLQKGSLGVRLVKLPCLLQRHSEGDYVLREAWHHIVKNGTNSQSSAYMQYTLMKEKEQAQLSSKRLELTNKRICKFYHVAAADFPCRGTRFGLLG